MGLKICDKLNYLS